MGEPYAVIGLPFGGYRCCTGCGAYGWNKSVTVDSFGSESNQMHYIPEVESDKAHLVPFLAPQGSQEAVGRMQWPPAQGKMERVAS
jgi:hypothetical protein